MTAQPPARRTESLFDSRYRYDHIYPRGRSGETLRAYDTLDGDRPVVIKRPAPQDAPPMRAGQEVSIRSEKQALERLAGHPVLTELRGSGTFRVGGHTHDYIVMDLATGQIVEDLVLDLAGHGLYLPELEALVIMDRLLDLLAHGHDKQVIYNDVDAKHLFWDRALYRLKVIDWGNAVFLDEPGALPNVTRATDIYQCGELLYFILTGGNRLTIEPTDGSEAFFVSFGADAERISARLQAIITKAVHPDTRRRYGTMVELRHALTEYRLPLEKTRDEIIARIRKRVRATASQDELEELGGGLRVALEMDPGYPDATALAAEIRFLLRQISVQADLDAIRIYLDSGNWPRAASLLHDLLSNAGEANEPLVRFLIASTSLLESMQITPPPAAFLGALDPLFRGEMAEAGRVLLTEAEGRPAHRRALWLLAEQLAVLVPGVVLLRPHLIRLQQDVPDEARTVRELLDDVNSRLDEPPLHGLTGLQVKYQRVADLLVRLEESVGALADSAAEPDQPTLLAPVIRARHAAQGVIESLSEMGHYVFSEPDRAGSMLRQAAMTDPTSPYFDALQEYFDEVHQAVLALSQFKPRGDGTNLAAWFADVREFLQPYLDDLPDSRLHAAAAAIRRAGEGWTTIINYLALGRRQPTIEKLREVAETIRPFNENIAAWLGTTASRLPDATFVERHSPNEALADALIEGWKAWDRGDAIRAAALAHQAHDIATTDGERFAADRLRRLSEVFDHWLTDDNSRSVEQTDEAETAVLAVLLVEEEQERRTFAEQMPNTTLYLRAMSRGIVAYMHQSSSAGWRALYMHFVLRGMLALLTGELDESEFWRSAAAKILDDARLHRAYQVLDRALTGRRLVQTAEEALNRVSGPADLEDVRRTLNAPLAGELLTGAEQAVQSVIESLRDWSDGDFYATRQALDSALANIQTAIETGGLHIEPFVHWVTHLRDAAAELQQQRMIIEQRALSPRDEPDPEVQEAHHRIVSLTLETIGPDYAHLLRQWDDMYQGVLDTYTTQRFDRREKLAAFDRHFTSLFVAKHPAYPLFRHWEAVTEAQPPDEAEDDMIALEAPEPELERPNRVAYLEDDREPEPDVEIELETAEPAVQGDLPWNWIIIGAVVILIVALGLAISRYRGGEDKQEPTVPAAGVAESPTRTPIAATDEPLFPAVQEPTATPTDEPSLTPGITPTPTELSPSATPVIVESPTPEPPTPAPSSTPTPQEIAAAPASEQSESADRDVLAVLASAESLPWSETAFAPGEGGTWRLSTTGAPDNTLSIDLPPDLINTLFEPGAANTVVNARAVLELISYDEGAGPVGFGLGAENTIGQRTIGEAQFVEANLVDLGMNQNGQFRSRTQVPQQNPRMEFALQRSNSTTLSFYVDGKLLGDSVALFAEGDPVTLVLFVTGQNVVVEVSSFTIDTSPRVELP